ncbi:hypothetical protein B0H14DRAFT_2423736 [Mycena olivaceomarginata]|nr:hypothetical protein B0H14DRAFT_2423736 [Mycena olivaceomarginata]
MHYILNIGDLLYGLWTGKLDKVYPPDRADSWPWRVLTGDKWTQHGAAVHACHHYFPDNFDRVPRNPSEKINSGYKAKEWQHWLFGLGPALLYGLLPLKYWLNFCKLVHVIRLLHQYSISKPSLLTAYRLVLQFTYEFEELYYERRSEHIHFVRQSIHTPMHMVQEVRRRTIGNLGEEIRQPKYMFANLSQRGLYRAQLNALKAMDPSFDRLGRKETQLPTGAVDIGDGYQLRPKIDNAARAPETAAELEALKSYLSNSWSQPFDDKQDNSRITRCARLSLPQTGQIARSRWGEKEQNRVTRMVKVSLKGFEIAEVQYFFRYQVEHNTPTPLAMVSVFAAPDRDLLQESFGTLWAARHRGPAGMRIILAKDVLSVVAMIPFPSNRGTSVEAERKLHGLHFLYEKMGVDSSGISSQ